MAMSTAKVEGGGGRRPFFAARKELAPVLWRQRAEDRLQGPFKLLQRFRVGARPKIVPSRITAVSAKKQRMRFAQAIKRARFLGLLPYVIR